MDVVEFDRSLEKGARTLVSAVWKHKLIFVLTGSVVFTLLLVGALAIQPTYEGSTLLIGGQVNLEQLPDGSRKPAETAVSLARIAESEEVVAAAIEKVGLHNLVQGANPNAPSVFARLRGAVFPSAAEPERDVSPMEAALPRIKRALNVKGELTTDIIRIAFKHQDPTVSADFANAVARAFIDRQIALYSRPGAAEFFTRQRRRFEDEFARASIELENFSAATAIYSVEDQRQLLLRRLNDLASASALTRGTISQTTGQRQALSDQLRRLAPVARSPYVSALVDSLGADRNAPGLRSGDARAVEDRTSDPPLLLVKVYQDSMVELFKANADLTGAQYLHRQQIEEMSKLTADLNKLSENERQFVKLKRAVDEAVYNSNQYSRRAVEEQINAESSAAKFSSVKVLQKATVPVRPVSPNYILVTLTAGIVGALAGVGAALLRHRATGRAR